MKKIKLSLGRIWVVLTVLIVWAVSFAVYLVASIFYMTVVCGVVWITGGSPTLPDWIDDAPEDFAEEVARRYASFFC